MNLAKPLDLQKDKLFVSCKLQMIQATISRDEGRLFCLVISIGISIVTDTIIYSIHLKIIIIKVWHPQVARSFGCIWIYQINIREYRTSNQKWTIQRNWQQDEEQQTKNTTQYVLDTTIRKTQDEEQHNKNTTQYVLDTTIRKQTQIT